MALTDSTAILTFLADRHGALTFPGGSLERARQDGFSQLILDEFDAVLWTAARHSFVLPETLRLPAIKDSLKWEFATNAERLSARLGDGPFLMGSAMTVPDVILTHCHHDHSINWVMFKDASIVIGADEMAWASKLPWGENAVPDWKSRAKR